MPRESGLRQRVVALLREHGFFVQAVESEVSPGMPDIYYRYNAWIGGWIELKQLKVLPKLGSTSLFASMNHGLSPEQVNWIKQETKHGGTCHMLVGFGPNYYLVPSSMVESFNDLTLPAIEEFAIKKADIPLKLRNINTEG